MRIGVNALFMIPGEVGGTETCLRRILPCAAGGFPEDEFIVFANAENRNVLASDLRHCENVAIVDMRVRAVSRWRRVLCEQFALPKALRRTGAQVLWNPGNAALAFTDIPQATAVYDMQFTRFPEDFSRGELAAVRRLTLSALKKSAMVFTGSEFSRQEIVRSTPTPFMRIEAIPYAASENFAKRLPAEFIAERVLALTHGAEPYLLCVANSYPHKNVETAVAAFGEIMAEIPHKLVIVGKPRRGEAAVDEALDALPANDRVTRLHYVTETDLTALYQGADMFVLPSKYEGFGLPIIEAMMAGTPVITTREGSIPEIGGDTIEYARTGDAADFAAAIRKILALDPQSLRDVTARAAARAARFSWDETARQTVEALKRIAEPQKQKRKEAKAKTSAESDDKNVSSDLAD